MGLKHRTLTVLQATASRRLFSISVLLAGLGVLGGCASLPPAPATVQLELMSSQPLVLADACQAQGTFRAQFMVLPDGRVADVDAAAAPDCVREGLSAWVQSFRYAPGTRAAMPHAVELVLVSAPRG